MTKGPTYIFGPYRLLPSARALSSDGAAMHLGGRAYDVLLALIERRDRVVSKHELMDLVWPRLVVEENNLQVQMVSLRKLLGHAVIATVPGRGYRFTLPVVVEGVGGADTGLPAAVMAPSASVQDAAAHAAATTNLPHWLPDLFGREGDLKGARSRACAAHR